MDVSVCLWIGLGLKNRFEDDREDKWHGIKYWNVPLVDTVPQASKAESVM